MASESLANSYPNIRPFDVIPDIRVPKESGQHGYVTPVVRGNIDDSARYILTPDVEFYRPFLANPPNGSAFLWPLGIQGFTMSGSATLGIHHFIGDNDIDIDIVYPDELHITMTGHFPGKTGVDFMHALRKVILERPPTSGKLLSLPGVDNNIQYVVVNNHSFTHDETDLTDSIAYSIEMIKVGEGAKIVLDALVPPKKNAQVKKKPKGKSTKQKRVKQQTTLRKATQQIYGGSGGGGGGMRTMAALISANEETLAAAGISPFEAPYTPLPGGMILEA